MPAHFKVLSLLRPALLAGSVTLFLLAAAACTTETTGAPSSCGNGALEPGEECEGFDLRGATCDALGRSIGQLRCSATCKLDTTGCGGQCGDGIVQPGEACDGSNLNGATCATLLGAGSAGTLACSSDCHFLAETCRGEAPQGALTACTPGSSTCPAPTSCVTTTSGPFCLEACALGATTCGADRYCEDVGGAGACASVPAAGQGCTERSGCREAGHTCIPTFSGSASAFVSTCAKACPAIEVGKGQGSCAAGASCVALIDGNGQCAPVTPLYVFDGTPVPDAILCDRTQPTRGAAKCGLVSATPLANPARALCVEHFTGAPEVGVCTAYCDGTVLGGGAAGAGGGPDGACGDGASCKVPSAPEYFLPQAETAVPCTDATRATACGSQFDRCLDLGRGLECARAVRICVPS